MMILRVSTAGLQGREVLEGRVIRSSVLLIPLSPFQNSQGQTWLYFIQWKQHWTSEISSALSTGPLQG